MKRIYVFEISHGDKWYPMLSVRAVGSLVDAEAKLKRLIREHGDAIEWRYREYVPTEIGS